MIISRWAMLNIERFVAGNATYDGRYERIFEDNEDYNGPPFPKGEPTTGVYGLVVSNVTNPPLRWPPAYPREARDLLNACDFGRGTPAEYHVPR